MGISPYDSPATFSLLSYTECTGTHAHAPPHTHTRTTAHAHVCEG
jgi:hypothetical protein